MRAMHPCDLVESSPPFNVHTSRRRSSHALAPMPVALAGALFPDGLLRGAWVRSSSRVRSWTLELIMLLVHLSLGPAAPSQAEIRARVSLRLPPLALAPVPLVCHRYVLAACHWPCLQIHAGGVVCSQSLFLTPAHLAQLTPRNP
jgi:hypothetical protein